MRTLPPKMEQALAPFATLFSRRIWHRAQLLLIGAILAQGRRTVSSTLRTIGIPTRNARPDPRSPVIPTFWAGLAQTFSHILARWHRRLRMLKY